MHSRVSTVQKKRWADPDYRARMLRTLEKARAKNLARYRTQPRIRYSTSNSEGETSAMKIKRIMILTIAFLLALSIGLSPAFCTDCKQADTDCRDGAAWDAFAQCCEAMGGACQTTAFYYCMEQSEQAYRGCMLGKGCTPRSN